MTAKHSDPEFRRSARIIRQQVAKARRLGNDVSCWRCGLPIDEQQSFDVGHINPAGGPGLDNLAPEHRYRSGRCQGNRAAGGRVGAAITNRHTRTSAPGLLPW